MFTSDFDYHLPLECIAQSPVEPRDSSRLMVLHRESGIIEHRRFYDLVDYLESGDVLVINETKVIPARLYARKIPSGGKAEILLLKKISEDSWEALVGGKGSASGRCYQILSQEGERTSIQAEILLVLEGARRIIQFNVPIEQSLNEVGNVPLPPYIRAKLRNPDRYQTVYARFTGSAAAPTAGLHFTPQLLNTLQSRGIQIVEVDLHIGLDTFAPITEDTPLEHKIHTEWCQVTSQAADKINTARKVGRRVIAVGTTSVRALESAAATGEVRFYEGSTSLFIIPGYEFKAVDVMITNFHLPRSTLILLVSAFAGRETILNAYNLAIREGYRFYSFGDAMLIL